LYYCCCAAKTVNKQGYIHASYQVAEMAFLSIMSRLHIFSTDISGISGGLNLAYAWRHSLFEAWLVNSWIKVDLVGNVEVFLPTLSQHNLNHFLAHI